ncbi:MAG: hypothetical protein SFT90_04040 [Rickettsiales bacterium]|nr:hypothetical protein [Rickettsiales bacterium]
MKKTCLTLALGFLLSSGSAFAQCACTGNGGYTYTPKAAPAAKACGNTSAKKDFSCNVRNRVRGEVHNFRQQAAEASCAGKCEIQGYTPPATQ